MLQSVKYGLLGSVMSLGAPGGLMVARLRQHHVTRVRFDRCVEELRGDRVRREIERTKRSRECVSLLFIDLDRLKSINDTHGHPAGDKALRHIARCISRSLRASDLGGRLGGDEFGVPARGITCPWLDTLASTCQRYNM